MNMSEVLLLTLTQYIFHNDKLSILLYKYDVPCNLIHAIFICFISYPTTLGKCTMLIRGKDLCSCYFLCPCQSFFLNPHSSSSPDYS